MDSDGPKKTEEQGVLEAYTEIGIAVWRPDKIDARLDQILDADQKAYLFSVIPVLFISSDHCSQRDAYIMSFPMQLRSSIPDNLRMIVQTGRDQNGTFTIGILDLEVIPLKQGILRFSGKNAEKVRSEIAYVTGRLIDGLFGISGR